MSDEDMIRITEADLGGPSKDDLIVIDGNRDLPGQQSASEGAKKPAIQWDGMEPEQATKEPVDIVLLIDTSGSMGADDYPPNRLAAAKEAAGLFTRHKVIQRYNDRVAVIGFGGNAGVVHALDSNLEKVAASLDKLAITHTGTMIGAALQAAVQELNRYNSKRRAIVLLSDGGDEYDNSAPLAVAGSLKGIKVFTIGIGTLKGGMATLPHGRQKVFVNEQLLKQIAKVTGGEYLFAPDVAQLRSVYAKLADY